MLHKVSYAGRKRFHIADGGSTDEEIDHLKGILNGQDYTIDVSDNLAAMVNSCARASDEVWWVTLDDFLPHRRFDLTPDVRFLLAHPDVGAVRMGRLAYWEHGEGEQIWAQMRMLGGLHWWVMDKARTNHPYVACLNTLLFHRRYWDAYGDIPTVPADQPGEAEIEIARLYNSHENGPTIAVPMRFGEDCGEWQEPMWQLPSWRTDAYAASGGGRRM